MYCDLPPEYLSGELRLETLVRVANLSLYYRIST